MPWDTNPRVPDLHSRQAAAQRRDAHDVRLPSRQRDALDEEAVGRPVKSVGMPPGEREHERRERGTCDFDRGNDERRGGNSEAAGTTRATERAVERGVLDGVDRIDARMLEGNRDTIVCMRAGSTGMVMRMGMVRFRMCMMAMNARMRIRLQILC